MQRSIKPSLNTAESDTIQSLLACAVAIVFLILLMSAGSAKPLKSKLDSFLRKNFYGRLRRCV